MLGLTVPVCQTHEGCRRVTWTHKDSQSVSYEEKLQKSNMAQRFTVSPLWTEGGNQKHANPSTEAVPKHPRTFPPKQLTQNKDKKRTVFFG